MSGNRNLAALGTLLLLLTSGSGNGIDSASTSTSPAEGAHGTTYRSELAEVNLATAAFQEVGAAEAAGYAPFLECFESPERGGMGQHYVNHALLDDAVEATAPESIVYEVTTDGLELVAVEYIVPGDLVHPEDPPEVLGQTFHLNEELGVWVLHAWVWKDNPAGVFEDWNPKVRPCPTDSSGAGRATEQRLVEGAGRTVVGGLKSGLLP